MRYPALIDGQAGVYGVVFPDLPGCVAMGATVDEAIRNAEDAMRDWIDDMDRRGRQVAEPSPLETVNVDAGSTLTSILLVPTPSQKDSVRLNLVLDAEIAEAINAEAERRRMTRKDYLEWMVRFVAGTGA